MAHLLSERQFDRELDSLGEVTSISVAPKDSADRNYNLCVHHPCHCCRSRACYGQIFGFDEGLRLQGEENLERENGLQTNRTWIREGFPSECQQAQLRDSFIQLLPASSMRNTAQWPQGKVKIANRLSDIKWAGTGNPRSEDDRMREALEHAWPLFNCCSSRDTVTSRMSESFQRTASGRYVKSECVPRDSSFMTFQQISLLCCIFTNIISYEASGIIAVMQLLQTYTSAWEDTREVRTASDRFLFQQFHLRYPEICPCDQSDDRNPQGVDSWIRISREKGRMPQNPDSNSANNVVERRVSILFATENMDATRPWKIFALADKPWHDRKIPPKSMEEELQQSADKQSSRRFFALLNTLKKQLKFCSAFWELTLDDLEMEFRIKITHVTKRNTLERWMFDGESNERSKLYFERLSMLQILSDWARDTSRDLSTAVKAIPSKYTLAYGTTQKEIEIIAIGVEGFQEVIRDTFKAITDRIDHTRDDIVVFRDGMFNSTSIREAHEVTRQGHYVFLFTIMTIVYLPLAFVTGFFGMNNLENVNGSLLTSWTPFVTVFTVVAIVTYVTAWLTPLWVHWHDPTLRWDVLKKDRVQGHGDGNNGRTTESSAGRTTPIRWLRQRLCYANDGRQGATSNLEMGSNNVA